ncbi:MAG: hypothetical protein ACXVB2_06250 [Isosphaeraceae bacterium]
MIATADVGAVGLFSGADPPRLVGHTPSLPAIMPGWGGWTKTPAWEPIERGGDVVALVART